MSPSYGWLSVISNCCIRYDTGVQQFGSWAISNLALAGDDVRLLIRGTGIIEVCFIL